MKIPEQLDNFSSIEQKISFNIDLLEITKDFCEFNFDKAGEISALFTMLEVILAKQKEIASDFDDICIKTH